MTVAARMRRSRGFAARLVGCVLLSAAVTGAGEAALAAQLADRSVLRESLAAVAADATAVQRLSDRASDPWEGAEVALSTLAARPEVLTVRLLDRDGSVRETVSGLPATPAGPGVDEVTREQVRRTLASGSPQAVGDAGGNRLSLVVPTRVDGDLRALQVVVDAGPAAARAATLRRSLLALLAIGLLAVVPLALAFGGRRLIRQHRLALQAADRDDLTGIGNRRAFRHALDEAVDSALDHGRQLALLLVEVRGLAAVNEVTGRRRGDALLTAAAASLLAGGPPDTVFRTGGDGFAVLVPGADLDRARELAGRMAGRLAVDVPPLTALVGVCALDDRCPDAEMLLIGADAALAAARSAPARVPVPVGAEDVWDIRDLTGESPEQG